MNKSTFMAGKTYLTRHNASVRIVDYDGEFIIGIITYANGCTLPERWHLNGEYLLKFETFMDLMPDSLYENNISNVESLAESLKKENASLFKANLDLLAEVDALQKENGRLYVDLQEARIIARGMVDAMIEDGLEVGPMCECHIFPAESAHSCPFYGEFTGIKDERHCTCCKKCTENCSKMAAQGAIDAEKCGAFDRKS